MSIRTSGKSFAARCLLSASIAVSVLFSHAALATFKWPEFELPKIEWPEITFPTVTVNKYGDVAGDFLLIPNIVDGLNPITLNPNESFTRKVPGLFWVGEKDDDPLVDISIQASGDLWFGGLETRNELGFEYAGYAGVCKGECVVEFTNTVVPIPAAAWLFGSALLGLFGLKRRLHR